MWVLLIFLIIVVGVWLAFGRKAAGKTILVTILVAFVGFVVLIIWLMNAYPSNNAPTQSNTTYNTPSPIANTPTQSVNTNENTVPIYTNTAGEFYLTIPRGNNSTCTWTWVAGSAAIPYSQTTYALAGQQHMITIAGVEGSTVDDFKVTCVDDFGDQYVGVPSQ
jgi:hypothetical protein